MAYEVHRSANCGEMRSIVPAIVLGSALWLLLIAGVALKQPGHVDEPQAAAAHEAKWPQRYSKYADDYRRNGRRDRPSAEYGFVQHGRLLTEDASMETMLLLSASD